VVQLAQKKQQKATYEECFDKAKVAVIADYRGLTVSQLTQLRSELFQQDAKFVVVKNTILKQVIQGKDYESLEEYFKGPNAVLFGFGDEVSPVKTLKKYIKEFKIGEIKGGMLGADKLDAAQVNELADMPPLDVLRGKLLGAINTPNTRLVSALNTPLQGLVNVLEQYGKTLPQ
jgi:large subunit ribosomal protein L10